MESPNVNKADVDEPSMPILGTKIAVTTLFGYAILLSYTWPMGFIPIFSIESIPALVLAFAGFLISVQVVLVVLFWPINFLISLRSKDNLVRYWLYSRAPGELKIPADYAKKDVHSSWPQQLRDVVSSKGKLGLVFPLLQALAVLIVFWAIWYHVAMRVGTENFLINIVVFVILYIFYMVNSALISARTFSVVNRCLGAYLLVFIVLPTIPKTLSLETLQPSSNQFVADLLKRSKLGGGTIVEFSPSLRVSNTSMNIGKLLFYDGRHAWIAPCDARENDGLLIEMSPEFLIHNGSASCEPTKLATELKNKELNARAVP